MIVRFILIISSLFLLIGATLFAYFTLDKQQVPKAHAATYYADAIGRRQTDQCNRVHVTVNESPSCNRLTRNDPGVCTDIANGSTNNISTYTVTLDVRSNDGAAHTINYGSDTNFCDSGRSTIDPGSGYCSCIDNHQATASTILNVPASGTQRITLTRANPYGYSCGSYQMDFWINSVDGNNGCTYGNATIVGASGLCETGTTCVPRYTVSGNVFVDTNRNGTKDSGEGNYTGATVRLTGTSSSTGTSDASGNYSFASLAAGNYTNTITVPAGYINTTPTAQSFALGPTRTVNFGIAPNYTVSGNVYIDANKNGVKDVGEANYTGSITIASSRGSITTGGGSYTVGNLTAGAITVSYTSLPTGYNMTYPLNGPPPSFQVTVGGACTTNGASGASCTGGNITNLSFGITNLKPWLQSTCGSIRNDNGITNPVPAGLRALATSAACNAPGIAFSGDGSASFTPGQASNTNWVVGGLTYPEVYVSTAPGATLSLSYASLLAKQQHARLTTTNLSSICSLSSCTLPTNLPHGIYTANGNVTLNSYTFPANQNYIFLINGNLTITGPVLITAGSGATALFSASGNIVVNANVGVAANSTQTSIEGIYSTDRSFILPSAGTCTDLRLNIGGNIITNAARTGGSFQNNRDLCANDATYPTVSFTQRMDLLLNTPTFLQQQESLTTEVAP